MNYAELFPFGDCGVVTVRKNGLVDIRVVDDSEHRTLTGRMRIDEFVEIAKGIFRNVRDDSSNSIKEKEFADILIGKLSSFGQVWGEKR